MRGGTIPLTGCDSFHLALDGMMRQSGQGPNVALAVLDLAGPIPPGLLRRAVDRLRAAFPIVEARIRRRSPIDLPAWDLARATQPPSIAFWHEPDAGPTRDGEPRSPVRSLTDLACERLESGPPADANVAFDEVVRSDGTSALIITWRHVLLDARGGELLVTALDRLAREPATDVGLLQASREVLRSIEGQGLRERLEGLRSVGLRLDALREPAFRSLGGPETHPGAPRFRLMTLGGDAARTSFERAESHSGAFARMAFFLAAAVRSHHAVFRLRGTDPGAYVVSIPVQMQRKGSRGPIFQNHLSILFFGLPCTEVDDLGGLAHSIRGQLAEMMRSRLDQRWADGLRLARRVPSGILMHMVRRRFRGEIASFFHSFTGSFADDAETLFGVRIVNAYHVPTVARPPGSGLFVGEHRGRLNVTLSWRDGVLSEPEADVMLDALRSDLLGDAPTESTARPRAAGAGR